MVSLICGRKTNKVKLIETEKIKMVARSRRVGETGRPEKKKSCTSISVNPREDYYSLRREQNTNFDWFGRF